MAAARNTGLATILGVSNVSHGLPSRPLLNAAFFDAAVAAGLDSALLNPNDSVVMEAVRIANSARAAGADPDAHHEAWAAWDAAYESALDAASRGADALAAPDSDAGAAKPDARAALETAVLRGDAEAAPALVDAVISEGMPVGDVIGSVLTPAIQRLGDAYGRGEVFLPQMMIAAGAMKAAVARVKELTPEGEGSSAGRVVFATVKGDVHSIGKDICISLLESQGFEVTDLGVDVPAEKVVAAAADADAVCLSALMTTTLPSMSATVAAVRADDAGFPVLVGGAVVTREWATSVGAEYSEDAPGCVAAVREAIATRRAADMIVTKPARLGPHLARTSPTSAPSRCSSSDAESARPLPTPAASPKYWRRSRRLRPKATRSLAGQSARSPVTLVGPDLEMRKHSEEVEAADAVLVLSCGAGVQTVAESVKKPVFPGLESAFLGNVQRRGVFEERCQMCGDCVLDKTAGICPVTTCPKGLLNGPCGGMWDGMCEVMTDHECAHVKIRERLSEQGRSRRGVIAAKDYSAKRGPGSVNMRDKK